MDDLQVLAAALAPEEPSPAAFDRSRHQLQNRMRGGSVGKPRRKVWWVVGSVLAAGATAVAVAVATGPPAIPDAPSVASAQQILLATAVRAEQADDGTGAYWYRKIVWPEGAARSG